MLQEERSLRRVMLLKVVVVVVVMLLEVTGILDSVDDEERLADERSEIRRRIL